jgi:benzoate membrane transport protein
MLRSIGWGIALPRRDRRTILTDINSANVSAGMTAGLFYAFGATPVLLDSMASLHLSPGAAASWFFVTFMTSALGSLFFTLRFRQPIPIGWTLAGLVFLASNGDRFSHAEIAGACLLAGVIIVALGVLGVAERLMRWLPLSIVMGMFAGSVLGTVGVAFKNLETQPFVVGSAIAGYVGARALNRSWCPPMAGAFLSGIVASVITGQVAPAVFHWSAPSAIPLRPAFDPSSILTLSAPLVIMAIGIGNVQGLGFLTSQGYRPPVRLITIWLGLLTLVNASFGGHVAAIQNNGSAVLGGPDAGPPDSRYMSSVIASMCAALLGLCAACAGTLLAVLPGGFVPALAGLALLSALMDALRRSTQTELPMGALFALAIAASRVTLLGIGAGFWALIGGLVISFVLERPVLRKAWQTD